MIALLHYADPNEPPIGMWTMPEDSADMLSVYAPGNSAYEDMARETLADVNPDDWPAVTERLESYTPRPECFETIEVPDHISLGDMETALQGIRGRVVA